MRSSDRKRKLTSPAVAAPMHSVVSEMLSSYVILQKKMAWISFTIDSKKYFFLNYCFLYKKNWHGLACIVRHFILFWIGGSMGNIIVGSMVCQWVYFHGCGAPYFMGVGVGPRHIICGSMVGRLFKLKFVHGRRGPRHIIVGSKVGRWVPWARVHP